VPRKSHGDFEAVSTSYKKKRINKYKENLAIFAMFFVPPAGLTASWNKLKIIGR